VIGPRHPSPRLATRHGARTCAARSTTSLSRSQPVDRDIYSFFTDEADQLVKDAGWTELVFCGLDTESCVQKSAVDAFELGYRPGYSATPPPVTPVAPPTKPASSLPVA
jgi:hypothetical protein